jgi:16S rRNA processing protein RimM
VINYLVIDENFGEIGKIKNIKENISQDLFVIDYKSNDVLIPIHDEFISNVDRDKKQIIVKTPEGLIDLYLNF